MAGDKTQMAQMRAKAHGKKNPNPFDKDFGRPPTQADKAAAAAKHYAAADTNKDGKVTKKEKSAALRKRLAESSKGKH